MGSATEEDYLRIAKAFKFYQVKTEGQLILAMLHHIERLQDKLPPLRDTQPKKVREG